MEGMPEQRKERSIQEVRFEIAPKSEELKKEVMDLLHEYPENFVPGLFEQVAEQDFAGSDVVVAYDGTLPWGALC